ncbi:hypothetical protein J6W34_07225 [bacterium]|nr:hypothetical protein [bacterium]
MDNNITIELEEYDELKDTEFKYEFIIKWLINNLYYSECSDNLVFQFRKDEEFISIMKILEYRFRRMEDIQRHEIKDEGNEEDEDRN